MSGPQRLSEDQDAANQSYREIASEALRSVRPVGLAFSHPIDDVFTPTDAERARAETPTLSRDETPDK